jgi:putative Mn2+ efflux pump MntP
MGRRASRLFFVLYGQTWMSLPELLLMAVGLAMDAFAVSLGVGTTRFVNSARPRFRLAWHFGLFQALMPALGWLVGSAVVQWIAPFDHWVALGLLSFVGVRMIRSGLSPDAESYYTDPSRGGTLVLLSVATSIDAFAVGLSLAVLGVPIVYPAVVIGVVTGLLSLIGLLLGNRLGKTFGKRMEIAGGVILIAIGVRIVVTHLFPGSVL